MPRFRHITGLGNVQFTPEEEAEADAQALAVAEYRRLNEYKDKRQLAYPSYADQLDTIYHQGLDAWKAEIKTIKDKYPKP
tara:strand:- start:8761 stop:9000 length:240 start_codon:yes stop_codon:yes gene_type:complete